MTGRGMRGAARRLRARLLRAGWPRPPASALVIMVPAAGPLLLASADGGGAPRSGALPPHITLLYPFLPPSRIDGAVEHAVARLLASFEPFAFALESVGRFPGVLYVTPEPAERFRELTEALWCRWPSARPYRGAYADIVPHLTVAMGSEQRLPAALRAALPVHAVASEVSLMVADRRGRWSCRRSFQLGLRPVPAAPMVVWG